MVQPPGSTPTRRPTGVKKPPEALEIGEAPKGEDPKAKAEYFMELLEAFAQQGTAEAKRIRSTLIHAISEYSERSQENKEEALEILKAKLYGLEAGLAELLLKSVRKMHKQIVQQARKLGSSPAGKNARAAGDTMSLVVGALETMLQAANTADEKLRDRANEMMQKAREAMHALEQG